MCGSCCWTGIIACGRGPGRRIQLQALALNQGMQKGEEAVVGGRDGSRCASCR